MGALVQSDIVVFYDNGTAKAARENLAGGLYIWENESSSFGGTINLQSLGADGSTYKTVTTATTNAPQQVYVAAGATMKVTITGGPPTALYSRMSRVPV